ncbi:MAG: hypothetical protein ACQEUZ_15215, partial [Pseudomonadota bacterium]
APAIAHYEISGRRATLRPGIEAVAVVGSVVAHAFAGPGGPESLAEAERIATGPEGSPSHALAVAAAAWGAAAPEIIPLADSSAATAAAAIEAGGADAALVLAEPGRADLRAALGGPRMRVIDSASWWRGSARLALPFLRPARVPPGLYGKDEAGAPAVAMQLTLAGPAPPRLTAPARHGPSVYAADALPITDAVVRRLNAALGPGEAVGPHLRAAAVIAPGTPRERAEVNPNPDRAVLSVLIFGFLGWTAWLYARA